jgi:predicted HTH domain antitoxin
MTHVDVTVPDGLLAALKKAPYEVAAELRLAAAIHWYQQSLLSMERAAETAGMTRAEFLAELARRRVDVFVVDDQDLVREADTTIPACQWQRPGRDRPHRPLMPPPPASCASNR